ncbi:hypothetical protein B0H14DRAFT_3453379 [Mycena olivaceomarginata]|nr:hypothetical protein B0H14DRAFT_3453379 [Mycena olivaceomarginata]
MPPVTNPLIVATSIRIVIRDISFQLSLLPPQSHVLALCIIAFSSLVSFTKCSLAPPPCQTKYFADSLFFNSGSGTMLRSCGARRAPVCRALHAAALKAACLHMFRAIHTLLRPSTATLPDCLSTGTRGSGSLAQWEAGVMLQVTTKNTASCYVLEMLEQS